MVRPATLADLTFVRDLQRTYSNQLGFLRYTAIFEHYANGHISVLAIDRQPHAYLIGTLPPDPTKTCAKVLQIATAPKSQHWLAGTMLLNHFTAEARHHGCTGIQAMCREDLSANEFWKKNKFIEICRTDPKNARKKMMICWRLPLVKKLPLWFAEPPTRSGSNGKSTTLAQTKGIQSAHHNPARWVLPHAIPNVRTHTRAKKSKKAEA